jgi:hypothetical protein
MFEKILKLVHQTIYSSERPKNNHLLLASGVLDRQYLACANRLMGGNAYSSILDDELLDPPADQKIYSIYFDLTSLDGVGQLFVVYDRI